MFNGNLIYITENIRHAVRALIDIHFSGDFNTAATLSYTCDTEESLMGGA
jgi:hypothetical protein